MKATEKNKEQCRKWYYKNREIISTRKKLYYQKNREQILRDLQRLASHLKWRQKLKRETLTHYGNGKLACVRCDNTDMRVLTLDHINGGGCKDRKSKPDFYSRLRKQGYPEGYQTLCMNCQFIKKFENKECRKRR